MVFNGTVIVSGHKVGRPSRRIVMHQKGLRIHKIHVIHHSKDGDREMPIDRMNHHGAYDEIRLHSGSPLPNGSYTISMSFKGVITRAMNGMYPCFFTHDKKEKVLIGTQFESHHAREVFPCIDEPEAKATFDLTLTSPEGEAVISNTPIKTQTTKDKRWTTTFERTPHMSTYLLAFVFGEMKYLEKKTKKGVIVRTYATPDNVNHTQFALDCAVKILDFYTDYFAIDYPLEKCDMIALPDFASGAMENWGCITYREHALLVDPKNTSLASKQYVAMVVAHELAHQWFGNLVTMRWWTDLWLNEGFASWIEYLAVDHLFPDWKMWTQFIVDEQQQALRLDSLEHTHAIEVPINHPDEIRTIFDAISYSKGSSVIHMLHQYLGPEVFRDGLRYYLRQHAYKNTDTDDLWQALEEVSDMPVKQFMHAWTTQAGYPIVQVTSNNGDLHLEQHRFILNPKHKSKQSPLWPVALLSEQKNAPRVLSKESVAFKRSPDKLLKMNLGQSGFYRTSYTATELQALGKQISTGHVSPVDRMGLLADAFEAAKASYCDTTTVLHLLDAYREETDNAVWDVIASNLATLRMVMNSDTIRESLKPYVRKLIHTQRERLGWEPGDSESHFDRLLRPTILGMAAVADEPEVVTHALKLFDAMHKPEDVATELRFSGSHSSLKRGEAIDPDMRGIVYGTAARHGDKDTFDKLLGMHNATQFSEERLNLCAALCGFKQPELIQRALGLITTDAVRLQDVAYWLVYNFSNRFAREATWQWVVKHWDWLETNLGNDLSFYRLPIYVARSCSDATFLDEFSSFFNKHMSSAFERNIKQGTEIIEWQSAWRARDQKTIEAFFKARQESA